MFSASAEFYDLMYSAFKDYGAEATHIACVLRDCNPRCSTVLDAAAARGSTRACWPRTASSSTAWISIPCSLPPPLNPDGFPDVMQLVAQ